MPLETYLTEGEEILAQAGNFYASNKRLIRYQKRLTGEELDDIPYSHLTSIGVVRSSRQGLIKAGITIAVIGVSTLLTLMAILPILKSVSGLLNQFMGLDFASLLAPLTPISIITLILGIVLIAVGIFFRPVFIQFRAPGLNKEAETKFRLGGVHKETSLNLVRTIRQRSLDLDTVQSELRHVRPPEDGRAQTQNKSVNS